MVALAVIVGSPFSDLIVRWRPLSGRRATLGDREERTGARSAERRHADPKRRRAGEWPRSRLEALRPRARRARRTVRRTVLGVGEWTAQYIAMRALREPDAFPTADVGLLRAMAVGNGRRPAPSALLARAERWRPWRAYAAQHLWTRAAPRVGRAM